jgi:hypothetical protein
MPRIGTPLSNNTCGARGLPSRGNAGRAARQDDALGLQPVEGGVGLREGGDFGIDPGFAHAAGDQLSDLAAEIDDQDRLWAGSILKAGCSWQADNGARVFCPARWKKGHHSRLRSVHLV